MSELASWISTAIEWGVILVSFAVSIVALAKLRTTPAGLALGVGFFGLGLGRLVAALYRSLVVSPALAGRSSDVDEDAVITSMLGMFSCVNAGNVILALGIGLGAALVPYSLRRLATRGGAAPTDATKSS